MIRKWPRAAFVQMFILLSEPACGSYNAWMLQMFLDNLQSTVHEEEGRFGTVNILLSKHTDWTITLHIPAIV